MTDAEVEILLYRISELYAENKQMQDFIKKVNKIFELKDYPNRLDLARKYKKQQIINGIMILLAAVLGALLLYILIYELEELDSLFGLLFYVFGWLFRIVVILVGIAVALAGLATLLGSGEKIKNVNKWQKETIEFANNNPNEAKIAYGMMNGTVSISNIQSKVKENTHEIYEIKRRLEKEAHEDIGFALRSEEDAREIIWSMEKYNISFVDAYNRRVEYYNELSRIRAAEREEKKREARHQELVREMQNVANKVEEGNQEAQARYERERLRREMHYYDHWH